MNHMEVKLNEYINHIKSLNYNFIQDIGCTVLVSHLNESLFGNESIDIKRLELVKKGFTINIKNETHFVVSEFSDYLEFLKNNVSEILFNKISDICPINYYLLTNEFSNENNVYYNIHKLLFDFRNFLVDKGENQILSYFWPNFFKGKVISESFNEDPYMMLIKFNRSSGRPLLLNITKMDGNGLNLFCNSSIDKIDYNNQENNFQYIIKEWKEIILMDNEEEFIINNLSNVIGSVDMAKFIFKSYSDKKNYVINIEDINNIINFSSNKSKKEYLEEFTSNYKECFIIQSEKLDSVQVNHGLNTSIYLLNFEGFNKYLLNIGIKYLKSFEDKEIINDMYYNITNELLNSYQKLYKYMKKYSI